MSRAGGRLTGLALACASTLVALGVAEVAVRQFAPALPGAIVPDSARFYRYAAGGRKDYRRPAAAGAAVVPVRINGAGYRGPELPPRSGAPRLLVLGDSYVAAEFSPEAETFVEQLRQGVARAHGDSVESVNAGVPGYGPWQAWLTMREALPVARPDAAVLVLLADNDFGDVVRDRRVRVAPDGEVAWQPVRLTDSLAAAMSAAAEPRGLDRLHLVRWARRALGRRANADPLALDTRSRELRAHYRTSLTEGFLAHDSADFARYLGDPHAPAGGEIFGDHYALMMAVRPRPAMADTAIALMGAVLRGLRAEAAARALPVFAVVVPSALDACVGYALQVDAAHAPGYDRRLHQATLVEVARAAGLPVLDLWPALEAAGACDHYYPVINHWNARGQALAARLVTDSLRARGWLGLRAR